MSENGITHYCLGNGALKCDGCGQEKNWQTHSFPAYAAAGMTPPRVVGRSLGRRMDAEPRFKPLPFRAAGPGELIYYEGGREAALALEISFVPVDHTIVGIVDDLHLPA